MQYEPIYFDFFFFNDTATTEIYTLSLHDALPIWKIDVLDVGIRNLGVVAIMALQLAGVVIARQIEIVQSRYDSVVHNLNNVRDRKSTRLNSSHLVISYAVFCLKKKKTSHLLSILC